MNESNGVNTDRSLKKESIANILEGLSVQQLVEVEHLLATYKNKPEEEQGGKVMMHLFGRFAGLKQLDAGKMEMGLGLQNVNTYGVAQGGSIYTLADVAIGFKILERLLQGQKVFTLEMKVNFINKGVGTRLIATPSILRWGKSTVVAECTIEDDGGEIVAKALGTFYVR
ncbi:PaaI family thioesterase [Peribacillus butanolivorans]|uniref:PaaI family thioesterase n=1 Tax=Peribacillus butanolivorans TaxID=421767 RepID=UPI003661C8D6